MTKKYSQLIALKAITKASLLAIVKYPGAIFFSLVFPLVFIWIFGSFGGGSIKSFKVVLDKSSDTSNVLLLQSLKQNPLFRFVEYKDSTKQRLDLEKGRIAAVLLISANNDETTLHKKYTIHVTATTASTPELTTIIPVLENIADKYETAINPKKENLVSISKRVYEIREFKQIDFILPGQIGFSILFSTLFGVAFTFYNLREQLVLKRFYASPINRLNILFGIGFSRLVFQLVNVVVLLVIGKYFLGFTLAHGFVTFIEIMLLTFFMLLMLMGVALIFSSIVKTDSTIPLLINLFGLPQILLSGTFFSITVFPSWMQTLCKILPLTHFNIAMRKISFEGLGILDCWDNIGVIAIWFIVVYALVYKFFKWE
ncbi:MAG: ABC transporter permease [Chitinophagaceae bacterium]|nr:ABC transporter permease [Chitinophagaceae bacterium]